MFSSLVLAASVAASVAGQTPGVLFDSGKRMSFSPGQSSGGRFEIPDGCGEIEISTRMRTEGVKTGAETWRNARIPMSFHDASGKMVGGWPECFGTEGTHDWFDVKRSYIVPRGAKKLHIFFGNYGTSGVAEFDPFVVKAARKRAEKPCNAPLPEGAPGDPWSLEGAQKRTTATRARWCLNGLWGLRPPLDRDKPDEVPGPEDCWGWGKIPSVWSQKESWKKNSQRVWLSPYLLDRGFKNEITDRAWYMRRFEMPRETAGRKTVVAFTMLHTRARVYVDGAFAAEVSFPGGEADITNFVKPGEMQTVAIYATAYPLDAETLTFNAPDRADRKKADIEYRGIAGDIYLDSYPKGTAIASATVECDVAAKKAVFKARLSGARKGCAYRLVARVAGLRGSADAARREFSASGLVADDDGRISFTASWPDPALWDVHTPGNRYACLLALEDAEGRTLDAALPFAFGFRDVEISGRDILLNGIPVHLRALVARNMKATACVASRDAVKEMCRRMRMSGVNFLICDNYNFSPGGMTYFDAFLDVCDEEGMLVSVSLPHVRDFGMKMEDKAVAERYGRLARWVVERFRNHPCIVAYAMNHNAGGYTGDMDPLRIDGKYDLDPDGEGKWAVKTRDRLRIAHAIAKKLDPTRPAYHHESGNLDEFHTTNIYLDWAPRQERSDWLEHWSREGVKPLFFVEWGPPHVASWSSYRGPLFIHGAKVRQTMWASEYAAALFGDAVYGDDPENAAIVANDEKMWAKASPPAFYEASAALKDAQRAYCGVQAAFMDDNWRSHRAWGVSAALAWDQGAMYRRLETGVDAENPARWENLKRPGIVPDVLIDEGWFSGTGDAKHFEPTAYGKSMRRWNMDDCAFIGGGGVFTDKSHHFRPGDKVSKTLVIINDRRVAQNVEWRVALERTGKGGAKIAERKGSVLVAPGTRKDVPVEFELPKGTAKYALEATFGFAGGVRQSDVFTLEAYEPRKTPASKGLLLYDTAGYTSREFDRLGIEYTRTDCGKPLPPEALLAVGRESLTKDLLDKVLVPVAKNSGRVLVFEQKKDVLQAVGFRAQTYGLRKAFPRSGEATGAWKLDEDMLRDWNGESTIEPPYLENIPRNEVFYNKDKWAYFENTRVWRCRNRGCVATAVPEKPTVGDWCARADGGFDLQYAPLLDWTIDAGRITFCQFDVTARTIPDPVAEDIVRTLVARLCGGRRIWPKNPRGYGTKAENLLRDHETSPKLDSGSGDTGLYSVYVASPGGRPPADFAAKIANGGRALLLGLSKKELAEWLPAGAEVAHTNGCLAGRIEKPPFLLDGLSNADWCWHGTMEFDAFQGAAADGNAAVRMFKHGKGYILAWQTPPWTFDVEARPYLRTTRRRADWMLWRILGNLECRSGATSIRYADIPVPDDDPYRYYRW